jgi:PPP family 3-phenylpropionic acid transporter
MIVVWFMSMVIPDISVEYSEHLNVSLGKILFRPHILSFLLVCFLMLASHGPYYTFYSIYLEDNNYSKTFIGEMWALGVIAEIVLFVIMHRLVNYFGLKSLLLFSLLLAAIRWLLIGYFINFLGLLIIAQLLHAATFGIYHAVAIQYVHKFFRGKLQGRGQALYSSVGFGAGMAVGSLVSGYVWDRAGALVCFQGAAISAFLAFIIAWVWIDRDE